MRAFHQLSALFWAIIALVHLVRAIQGWPVQVGATEIPVWPSFVIAAVTAGMSVWSIRLMGSK